MRVLSLILIASCASTPSAKEPAPPEQAMPVAANPVPAGPPLPPPPPPGGAPMPAPPPATPAAPSAPAAVTAPAAAAPAPAAPARSDKAMLPVAFGAARADVRAAFGKADPTGDTFDTFGSKGLVIDYSDDRVIKIVATTLAVGTTYRERVLGVAIGDSQDLANVAWGAPVTSGPGSGYDKATYETGAYRISVEIWSKDGDEGAGFGKVRARTIKRIEVTKR